MDDVVHTEQLPAKVNGRPFTPGVSGNVHGRPRGDYATLVRKLREHNLQHAQGMLDSLRARAATDTKAAVAFLEFTLGRAKPVEMAVPLQFDGSTVGLLQALFTAIGSGRIGFDAAAKLLASLAPHIDGQLLELKKEVEAALGK